MAKKQIPFIVWVMIVAAILGGLFALSQRKVEQKPGEQSAAKPTPILKVKQPHVWKATPTAVADVEKSLTAESYVQNAPAQLPPIAARQAELEEQVRSWQYEGFMALGKQKIGIFSRNQNEGGDFRVSEGETVEGIMIVNLTQTGAILQSGDARVILALERPRERVEREEPQPPPQPGPPRRRRSENRSDMENENRPDMRRSVDQPSDAGVVPSDRPFKPQHSDTDRNESPFRR